MPENVNVFEDYPVGVGPPESTSSVDRSKFETGNGDLLNEFSPDYIRAEIAGNLIGTAILMVCLLIFLIVFAFVRGLSWEVGLGAVGFVVLTMSLVWLSLVWPRIWFRHARWQLKAESLEILRGVLWKHRIAIPLGRVQHADVSQGPLLRHFGLGKLIINTAGTSNATIEVDGLSHGTAMTLRDDLVKQTRGGQVT